MNFRDELREGQAIEIDVWMETKSRSVAQADDKFLSCRIGVEDVEQTYGTSYVGVGSVTLDDKLIKKYNITKDNYDGIEIDYEGIIYKEFIKNKKFQVYHIEVMSTPW